jgi:hypothetical protein
MPQSTGEGHAHQHPDGKDHGASSAIDNANIMPPKIGETIPITTDNNVAPTTTVSPLNNSSSNNQHNQTPHAH